MASSTSALLPITQQPYSTWQLLTKLVTRPRVSLDGFEPLAIGINGLSCSAEQRAAFKLFFNTQVLPPSFLFNVSYRYLGQLLAQAKMPSNLIGLIHISSHYQILHSVDWSAQYNLILSLASCEQSEKGLHYQLIITLVQQGNICIECTNQILDKSSQYQGKKSANEQQSNASFEQLAAQPLSGQLARAYAKLSGDFNPIHLSHLLAKLLGMKGAVMHGMYNLHWSLVNLGELEEVTQINANFNQPCYLPREVALMKTQDNQFGLFSNGLKNRHLLLTIA